MMSQNTFINFRNYTHFSNFESIIKIDALVSFCTKNNIPCVTICDYMNLFGAAELSSICIKYKIKPIIGCLLQITELNKIPVFIYNETGYQNLSFLLTQTYMNNKNTIDFDELIAYKDGLILFTGDESIFSEINHPDAEFYLNKIQKEFENNCFIEINLCNLKNINNQMRWSSTYNIPIITTSTTRFLHKEDAVAMNIFQLIKTGDFYDESIEFEHKNSYMLNINDIKEELKIGVQNAYNLAKRCCFLINAQNPIIPEFAPNIDAAKLLYERSIEGLKKRLSHIPPNYYDRLNTEMTVLINKNFCEYFLVTADFVQYAKNIDVFVGAGRGSGAGCLIAYALNITAVDPIEHGLLFERFLNPERASLPDFDIDFEPSRRQEIIDYLREKYGKYGVTNIITYIVLQARAVIRDIGRVCRIPFRELIYITSIIPQDQVNPVRLKEALTMVPQLIDKYKNDNKYRFIFDIALKLEGLVRNFSKHAAGIIVSHIPIYHKCPLFRDGKGDIVTQFDLKYLEHVGLVKFDFLGLKTLTCLNKAIKSIKNNYNIDLNLNMLPLNDEKVFKFLNTPFNNKLHLEGIFQFEGNALNTIMINLKATRFNDLVALNALYRPGPMSTIPSYIHRKHGREKILYLHEDLDNKFYNDLHTVLESTYGILVYQEQIMQIVCILANFTMADADLLRRAMGKKKHDEMIANKNKFCDGCEKNGIARYISENIFDTIEKFAGYAFNKSHSVAYSMIAYQCMYLKTHFLHEFTESYLELESGDAMRIHKYLYEMIDRGYTISKPNIHTSEYCTIQKNIIYLGIMEIRNTNIKLANNITLNAPYTNVYDFVHKNRDYINKKNWECLVHAGLFDELDLHEEIKNSTINKYYKRHILHHNLTNILCGSMINFNVNSLNFEELLTLNQKAFTISPESYSYIFKNIFKHLNIIALNECKPRQKHYVAAAIISLNRKRKGNRVYAFIEIGDHTKICDFALFDQDLLKYDSILEEYQTFIFEIEFNKRTIIHNIMTVSSFLQQQKELHISIDNIEQIRKITFNLNKCDTGNTEIKYVMNGQTINANTKINLTFNNIYNILYL